MSSNQHYQNFYGSQRSVQQHPSIGGHRAHGRRSNVVALPGVRLSPLTTDEPLPPVPFLRGSGQLHQCLQWGNWRELHTRRPYRPRTISREVLRSPATLPEQGELRMVVVNIDNVQREVLIRPNTPNADIVTVSDVMEAVEYEARGAARQRPTGGGYSYNGRAIHRGPDNVWQWYGLDSSRGEDDVWVLYL